MPKIDKSGLVAGHKGITKAGDAGLRQASTWQPIMPAIAIGHSPSVTTDWSWSRASTTNSALCAVSGRPHHPDRRLLAQGELYQLRDEDGEAITEAEGKAACTDRFKIDPKVRAARRRNTPAKVLKNRAAGRGRKESARRLLRPPTRRKKKLARMWLEGLDSR